MKRLGSFSSSKSVMALPKLLLVMTVTAPTQTDRHTHSCYTDHTIHAINRCSSKVSRIQTTHRRRSNRNLKGRLIDFSPPVCMHHRHITSCSERKNRRVDDHPPRLCRTLSHARDEDVHLLTAMSAESIFVTATLCRHISIASSACGGKFPIISL